MLYMLHKKVNFSLAMIVTSAMICLIAGLGPGGFVGALVSTFTSYKTFETGMTVFMISVLGGICKKYGILEHIVESLGKLIRNPKAVLMLIPAVVGLLAVPGGAIMSVPFVDELGDRVQLPGQRKAVINLVFRHVGSMLMPYSTNILLVGTIFPQINIYHLILLNCGFFAINTGLGIGSSCGVSR
jgi:hypothetical protein